MRQPIHRWLTDLEHTACGLRPHQGRRRPLVVRGWQDVTCQRCLGSIHGKLEQLQHQQPGSQEEPQGHPCRLTFMDRRDQHVTSLTLSLFHTPTVCLDVTSLVVSSYEYDSGTNGPTRCALIGAALDDR